MPKIFTEQERETIRKKLLDAGINELSYNRYRNIAIDKIASEAGIAKGTFYNFFSSKEAFFYEIMHLIKERNRDELKALLHSETPSRTEIVNCLYQRYTRIKTVYDYFTPDEMKLIIRKLPDGDVANDSVEFAQLLCEHFDLSGNEMKAKVIVNMCNILAMAASNREMLHASAYEETINVFCNALADYIFKEVQESV